MRCRRRSPHRHVPTAVPSRAADHRQRGRGQQLRPRPLHDRQGDRGHRAGPDPEAVGPVHRSSGIPGVPLVRWRHRFGVHVAAHGAAERGLREEEQARVLHLPGAAGVHGRGRAVQLHTDHAHYARALGLFVHGGQRGHLRHMPPESGHRAPDVHQPEPADRPDRVVHHGVAEVRRGAERRPDRVPSKYENENDKEKKYDPAHLYVFTAAVIL